jgi:uncharacterized membrane protein
MTKADLWNEDIITIFIVLVLVAFDYIYKDWKEFQQGGYKLGVLKQSPHTPAREVPKGNSITEQQSLL